MKRRTLSLKALKFFENCIC